MPDLSHAASSKYWSSFSDPMIYRVVTFMEGVETWTIDGNPQLEQALTQLGQELDQIANIDMNKVGHEDQFLRLLANIKTGRGLRLLQAIDEVHPGSASKVLMYAEETSISKKDAAGFFLRRNIVFERLRLLSRVFDAQRVKLINSVLEGDE
jgi:intracellular multiplication protein IcmW